MFIQLNILIFYMQIPLIVSCTMHFEPHQTMSHLLDQLEFFLLKILLDHLLVHYGYRAN